MSVPLRSIAALVALSLAKPGMAADCAVFEALTDFAKTGKSPTGAECATYLTATATDGVSCHWSFAFREGKALLFSDELRMNLAACRPGDPLGADQMVNHPDSYDLHEWRTPSGTYAISIKDKGALNHTLVFLRYAPD